MKTISKIFAFLMLSSALSAAWTPEVPISGPDSDPASGAVLSVNSLNNGVAVFNQQGFDLAVQASFYTFGLGWGPIEIVSNDPIFSTQGDPSVSLNDSNYAVAVWEATSFDGDVFTDGIFSSFRINGVWSPFQRISVFDPLDVNYSAENPFVSLNNSGVAVAVWNQVHTDGTYEIVASISPFPGVWGTPVVLATPIFGGQQQDTPRVDINSQNIAAMVYKSVSDIDFLSQQIGASTYNPFINTWTSVILDPQIDDSSLPRVSIDENGNAVAVWRRTVGTISQVVASQFNFATQTWSPFTVLATADGNAGLFINNADVVVDQFGNATAVWDLSVSGVGSLLFSSRLPVGGTWSAPVPITFNGFLDKGLAQIEISADLAGNVMVIYFANDPFKDILTLSYFVGFGWQPPEFVAPDGGTLWLNVGLGSCGFALSTWFDDLTTFASEHFGPIPPPSDFTVTRCCQRFATQTGCACTLSWSPTCAAFFRIFLDGVLIATVPGDSSSFIVPCTQCSQSFSLVAVSAFGEVSLPVTASIP